MKKRAAISPHHSLQMVSFSLALLAAIMALHFWFEPLDSPAPKETSSKTLYPRPFSDQNITANAIVSDPRFSGKNLIDANANLAGVWRPMERSEIRAEPPTEERGTWLWTPLLDITPEYRSAIISGAKANGVNVIYLSIDSYLDIFALDDGPVKQTKKAAFDRALQEFVSEANAVGLEVDAEAGWRNWAEKGHEYKAFAVLEYAMEYNLTHAEKLRGFQYDIEPYLLPEYEADKKSVLRNFVALTNAIVARMSGSDLELSLAIPEFYDGASPETPKFLFGLRYGFVFDHLLAALERRAGSRIIIMAYRSVAEGENGSIAISEDEIERAAGYRTKVVVAQETSGDLPPHITFHNTSRAYYDEQVEMIHAAFADKESFGGLATHYVNTFLTLR